MQKRVMESGQEHRVQLGVLGDPIAQSRSPLMHQAALDAAGIPGEYIAIHVTREHLGDVMRDIRVQGFRGVNVTIPHKVEVMNYLDELDEAARRIGAVNTVVNEQGRLKGYNTDGVGYVRSLKEEAIAQLSGLKIMMLGAGGAARGVLDALVAEQPDTVYIVNRTVDKAASLAAEWNGAVKVEGYGLEDAERLVREVDVLINTTSVGMYPAIDELPFPAEWIPEGIVVSDLIYNPLETRLLLESKRRGCKTHGGLGMFIYQGAIAYEHWLGQTPSIPHMREALLQSLGNQTE